MNCDCENRRNKPPRSIRFGAWLRTRTRWGYRRFQQNERLSLRREALANDDDMGMEDPPDEELPGPAWGEDCAQEWAAMILLRNEAQATLKVSDFFGTLADDAETEYLSCKGTVAKQRRNE